MKTLIVVLAAGLGIAVATIAHFKSQDLQPASPAAAFSDAVQPEQQIAALQDTLAGALADLQALRADAREIRQSQHDLASRYDELQTDLVRMKKSNAAERAPLPGEPEPALDRVADGPGGRDDVAFDDPAARANRLAALDDAMYSQPPDPAWDDSAAAQVTSAFSQQAVEGSRLLNASCNGGICRAELHFDSEEALDDLLEDEQALFPWNHKGRMEATAQASGEVTAIMYVTRDGAEFPAGF